MKDNLIKWIPMTDEMHVLLLGKEADLLRSFLTDRVADVAFCPTVSDALQTGASFDLIFVWKETEVLEHMGELIGRLKEPGRFFFCMDNPLGLKYFAGALQKAGADYFATLPQAFGRRALKDRIEQTGLSGKYFYPYPDEDETEFIFTDQRGPMEDDFLRSAKRRNPAELQLFAEGDVALSLEKEGVFSAFANFFLAEIFLPQNAPLPVSYVKFSDHRKEEFQIFTLLSAVEKIVRKCPASPVAKDHVAALIEKEAALSRTVNGGYRVSPAKQSDEACDFPLHEGKTYDELVDEVLLGEGNDAALSMIRTYIDDLFTFSMTDFVVTEDFTRIFLGDAKTKELFLRQTGSFAKSFTATDVDLVMSNIIADGSMRYIIDYEWTYEFPIPVEYVVFRILRYYLYGKIFRRNYLDETIFTQFGISGELQQLFYEMERSFQTYLSFDAKFSAASILLEPRDGNTILKEHLSSIRHPLPDRTIEVYFDYGGGFTEEARRVIGLIESDPKSLTIDLPDGARTLRIDPAKAPGILSVKNVQDENGKENVCIVPGKRIQKNVYVLSSTDPFFTIPLHRGQKKCILTFSYDVLVSYSAQEETAKRLDEMFPVTLGQRIANKCKRVFS